jgi:CRISPR-associated endonuclease Cas1
MRRQASDSLAAWPADLVPPRGILVLSGYGLDVRVWRGRLRVADGIGKDRREAIVHRATGRLRRLVVLGHTGSVSLEATRWLADVGAGYLQIDADGRVLAAFGPQGTDRPGLRRAQARALDTPVGNDIVRRLLAEKVAAQAETLIAVERVVRVDDITVTALRAAAAALHVAVGRDELRLAEAQAAAAYWSAWSAVPVNFARRDVDRVPTHWRTFGSRTSPLTGNPRLAGNPANAICNYLYSLLEGEAAIAARIVGLDPGLGLLHADQLNRDSLAADLMEPVRPLVDRHVLDLLRSASFAANDFYETRQGVCRLTPPLARDLAASLPTWRSAVGRVAEDVARLLDDGGRGGRAMPTPLTGRNRSEARTTTRARPLSQRGSAKAVPRRCVQCGAPTQIGRRTCSPLCEAKARASQDRGRFAGSGIARLRELREAGDDPARTPVALAKMAARQRARQAEENAWNRDHPSRPDPTSFKTEVLPALQGISLGEMSRRTGLSVGYCARIKRGEAVPHPRWWAALAAR